MPDPIGGVQPFAELARAGVSVVYKGYRRADDRLVLLKTVRPERGDGDLVERFEEEARLAAQVDHPNVVAVYDAGRDGATAYLVTEFVEGLDLGALIERGPVPPALAAYILHEAARGLAAVHDRGILHRDLKPANILISAEGAVKLADFGLASLAPSGPAEAGADGLEVRGTLGYLAPEIVRGDPPGATSDLFSLGAILMEMLTGRPSFARDSTGSTLDAVLHHDPARALTADPRVPPALAALADGLLQKDPRERPSGAAAVADTLASTPDYRATGADDLATLLHDPEAYTAPLPPTDSPDEVATQSAPAPPTSPRRRTVWWIAASVVAAILLGVVGADLLSERPSASPPEASARDSLAETLADSAQNVTASPADTARIAAEPIDSPGSQVEPSQPTEAEADPIAAVPDTVGAPPPANEIDQPRDTPTDPDLLGATDVEGSEPEVEAVPGTLVVVADPWARVRVDGKERGTTPLGALTLAPGRHTVTLENPDFPPYSTVVTVESGGEERLAVSLWDLVGRVTLVVSPWAEVAVNGAYWDTVPPQTRPLVLPPGTHRLAFTHPSFGTREETLRIAAGESRTLRINFNEGGS